MAASSFDAGWGACRSGGLGAACGAATSGGVRGTASRVDQPAAAGDAEGGGAEDVVKAAIKAAAAAASPSPTGTTRHVSSLPDRSTATEDAFLGTPNTVGSMESTRGWRADGADPEVVVVFGAGLSARPVMSCF